MVKFLHTADWQLGLKLHYIPGDRGAKARIERFEAVSRLAGIARAEAVDAVVVAGDVFDDNAVGPDTIQAAWDVFQQFSPIPLLLLPGNHDAATVNCALAKLKPAKHIRLMLVRTPLEINGALFYPCPLERRRQMDDPTRHLPERKPHEPIRIAVAHGGVVNFDEHSKLPNLINTQAIVDKGFDYVALGDWHGQLSFGKRVWYSGTPEPTRFKEKDAGRALIVSIAEPGAEPVVQSHPIARTNWIRHEYQFDDDRDLDLLETWLEQRTPRSWTLIELRLKGVLSLAGHARLDRILEQQAKELLYLRLETDQLQDAPSATDLELLSGEGFIGEAAQALRNDPREESRDALRLLHRFLTEASR